MPISAPKSEIETIEAMLNNQTGHVDDMLKVDLHERRQELLERFPELSESVLS